MKDKVKLIIEHLIEQSEAQKVTWLKIDESGYITHVGEVEIGIYCMDYHCIDIFRFDMRKNKNIAYSIEEQRCIDGQHSLLSRLYLSVMNSYCEREKTVESTLKELKCLSTENQEEIDGIFEDTRRRIVAECWTRYGFYKKEMKERDLENFISSELRNLKSRLNKKGYLDNMEGVI
jgi:hypothetical protein